MEARKIMDSWQMSMPVTHEERKHQKVMWESRHGLLSQLRKGGSITCNGKEKKA